MKMECKVEEQALEGTGMDFCCQSIGTLEQKLATLLSTSLCLKLK